MVTTDQLETLSSKGSLLFCLKLVDALPSFPLDLGEYIGPTNAALIDAAKDTLHSAVLDTQVELDSLSPALSTLLAVAQVKAQEVAEKEFTPGNNYGFSGASDTAGYAFRYLSCYTAVLWHAVKLDAPLCANAFSGALHSYAIYSCDGDPKGAVRIALEEADEKITREIESAYGGIPDDVKNVPRKATAIMREVAHLTEKQLAPEIPVGQHRTRAIAPLEFDVFISFKNLDAKGCETRDRVIAERVTHALTRKGLSVFFSLESLERLGVSAYKKAIDDALDDAKVLVAIGTSRDNLESQWVRYEWDGFLQDIMSGVKPTGHVFVVIEGLNPRDLPRGLRHCQAFNFSDTETEKLSNFIRHSIA